MSAESANLSTFGTETETEAEIRSTSIIIMNIGPYSSYFLDPETGLQALRMLFLFLLLALRLFHFATDRRKTSHTDWCQYYAQSHYDGISS